MHKASRRISFISSALMNPTLILLFSIFACSLLFVKPLPKANIQIKSLDASSYRRILTFNPNVDLSDQFNFNVKQIFVYLRVIYPTKSSEILWSKIVQRGDVYKLVENVRSNYEIKGEVGRNVVLELRGNYFPFVGIIRDFSFGETNFIL
ncbi:Signal peptidase complex subunit 3 [Nosema granulosis]|uniref:Signal peptidase complex subunit 3 n=1 Tax=Nosema granulosis TaxID=83296 RepID=A0A9P6H1Q7_9MICR|nr:Signal peptidase complex subunit 3 [Nosema granulosis]